MSIFIVQKFRTYRAACSMPGQSNHGLFVAIVDGAAHFACRGATLHHATWVWRGASARIYCSNIQSSLVVVSYLVIQPVVNVFTLAFYLTSIQCFKTLLLVFHSIYRQPLDIWNFHCSCHGNYSLAVNSPLQLYRRFRGIRCYYHPWRFSERKYTSNVPTVRRCSPHDTNLHGRSCPSNFPTACFISETSVSRYRSCLLFEMVT